MSLQVGDVLRCGHVQEAVKQHQELDVLRYRMRMLISDEEIARIERVAREETPHFAHEGNFEHIVRRMDEAYQRAAAGLPPTADIQEEVLGLHVQLSEEPQ